MATFQQILDSITSRTDYLYHEYTIQQENGTAIIRLSYWLKKDTKARPFIKKFIVKNWKQPTEEAIEDTSQFQESITLTNRW